MMPTQTTIRNYLKDIEHNIAQGKWTEHTHRPAMKILLESLAPGATATNEPGRVECGAPDFSVSGADNLTIGWVETKDIGISLDEAESSDQLRRYRRALPNLLLTDYAEFRWYVDGERRSVARLARSAPSGKLAVEKGGIQAVETLVSGFLSHRPQPVTSPQALATHLARLAHMIRDIIVAAFEQDKASSLLCNWRGAFARVLIADLDQPEKTGEFADMLAQTLAYGLFSARIMDISPGFTRQEAQHLIPKTNPFLRDFFYQVSGPEMDDEPFAGFVDDLVSLLANTNMHAILANFGKRTAREDPIIYFYETFLSAYDPKLREMRGVYDTPTPVASYIVRSIDYLLRTRFKCLDGLADSTQIEIDNPVPAPSGKGGATPPKKIKVHKVLLLDPATGTATFPYMVVDHIRTGFMQNGNAGMWSGYVREHLLPRLFGFELLMAPYAVAHFKLSLQLAGYDLEDARRRYWKYDFAGTERVGVFLTNTLEGPHEHTGLPLFTHFLARETDAANYIKQILPVLVIFGNPPYSGQSANKGPWIDGLLKGRLPDGSKTASYYEVDGLPLGERNPKWLQDDYVKFIRWAQWRIERTGSGILAFITNHSYLDNPTFRGMRRTLMSAFTDIYILDLHGSAKKREVAPDGSKDENIFDIQQGVAIGIFVKEPGKSGPAQVHHADYWGTREQKYSQLAEDSLETTTWTELNPQPPFYLFVPQSVELWAEYCQGVSLPEIMVVNSMGVTTGRDSFATAMSHAELVERIEALAGTKSDDDLRNEYDLSDSSSFSLESARTWARQPAAERSITPFSYRCFDERYVIYTPRILARPREETCQHQIGKDNIALVTFRAIRQSPWQHVFVARYPVVKEYISGLDNCFVYPLYLDSQSSSASVMLPELLPLEPSGQNRVPNLSNTFLAELQQKLGITFTSDGSVDSAASFGPEDVFAYIYAVLSSPTYRSRYTQFLKADFPRIPIVSDKDLFRALSTIGRKLMALHTLDVKSVPALQKPITHYPVSGNNVVEKGHPRYDETSTRVYINQDNVKTGKLGQYFEGVSQEVWEFQVGGYKVCEKWLKDRVGRQLTYDDLNHYARIVIALKETIRLMAEIDKAIPSWPIE